jgi:hypothetical protein
LDEMQGSKSFTAEEAREVGERIGIEWEPAPFDVEQFRAGIDVELEHGRHDPATNVTDDDAEGHREDRARPPEEFPDYTRLERMEEDAKREHGAA